MEVRTEMIMFRSAACHSTCKDCLSVTRNCFPVIDLSPRSATDFVGGSAHPGLFASSGTVSPWLICLPAPPPTGVGGYAHPVLFDLFPMMSDCPKHACHIKARGPTGHDEECALQSLGIDMTRKIVESVRFETLQGRQLLRHAYCNFFHTWTLTASIAIAPPS